MKWRQVSRKFWGELKMANVFSDCGYGIQLSWRHKAKYSST